MRSGTLLGIEITTLDLTVYIEMVTVPRSD